MSPQEPTHAVSPSGLEICELVHKRASFVRPWGKVGVPVIKNTELPWHAGAGEIAVCRIATRRSVSTQLCRLLCRARVEQLAPVAIVTGDADAAVDGRLRIDAGARVEARIYRARIVQGAIVGLTQVPALRHGSTEHGLYREQSSG